jgi:hypothetical protein
MHRGSEVDDFYPRCSLQPEGVARGFYKALRVKIIHSRDILFFARLTDFNRKKPKICKLSLTVKLNLNVILTVKNNF